MRVGWNFTLQKSQYWVNYYSRVFGNSGIPGCVDVRVGPGAQPKVGQHTEHVIAELTNYEGYEY